MNKYMEQASHFMDILARAAVAAIMFVTTVNVLLRMVGSSLKGTVEIVQYLTALGIGLGLAFCAFHGGHVAVTFLTDKFAPRVQQFFNIVIELLVAGFLGVTSWQLFLYGSSMKQKGEIALTLGFDVYPVVFAVTAGFVVYLLVVLYNVGRAVKGLLSADPLPVVKPEDSANIEDLISQ